MPVSIKKVTLWLWLFACAALCMAQTAAKQAGEKGRPDLSGTWVLDRSKSNLRMVGGIAGNKKSVITLVIAHEEPELRVTRTIKLEGREQLEEWAYYTDARNEANRLEESGEMIESKTKWEGSRLVSRYSCSCSHIPFSPGDRRPWSVILNREISSDGKTLTFTGTMINQFDELKTDFFKEVYRRATD